MEEIKVADTSRYVSFYAYDSADHISPADGISSFTVYYFLNNGSPAPIVSETVTEKDSTNMKGWYTLAVDVGAMVSAEGVTSINIEASGMDPVAIKVKIVGNTTKEVYDVVAHADYGNSKLVRSTTPANSLDVSATGEADANVTQWLGTAAATPTVAGVPEVDITHWLGTAVTANVPGQPTVDVTRIEASTQSLIDLKDFVDSGYDPVTNKVQGVLLADTVTTVTNLTNAPTSGDLTATMKTSVNDQVVDVIRTDTTAEMSQGAPPAAPTFEEMVAYLYFKMRNKQETTVSEDAIFNNAGDTKLFKSTISDNGTTFTKQEYGTGA